VTFRTRVIKALFSPRISVFDRLCGTRPSDQTQSDDKPSRTRGF